MVVIANAIAPYELGSLELVAAQPSAGLIDLYVMTAVDSVFGTIFANRFPTPPIAWGFLTDDPDEEFAFDRLGPPYDIRGALFPETNYLEPRIGQIWPRIG